MHLKASLFALTFAALPAAAEPDAGAYLAARSADATSDYEAAAEYYTRALVGDRSNPSLLESTVSAYVGLGDVTRAVPVARRLQESATSQVANLVMTVDAARREAWEGLVADIDAGLTVGPLFDVLVRGWALVGTGSMGAALEAFGLFHKALALAYAGDFEGADVILSGEGGAEMRLTRRGVVAHATVLSQVERNEDAMALLDGVFGTDLDPALGELRAALEAGETLPFTAVTMPSDGVAEVLYSIGSALRGETAPAYTLIYSRLALALRPDHIEAILLTADLQEEL